MPVTWKIYGIFHPHTHDLLYIGQTRRAIHERKEEHLLDIRDTLISKKIRQIKETTGRYPDFGILQDGIKDKKIAHYRELSHIYKHLSEGTRLLNREARDWFYAGYDKAFSPAAKHTRSKPKRAGSTIAPLQAETYAKVQAIAPDVNVEALEKRWRDWLVNKNKKPPTFPDRAFIGFCQKLMDEGKS